MKLKKYFTINKYNSNLILIDWQKSTVSAIEKCD